MGEVLYWEDVREEQELPIVTKRPTAQQLVKYAAASGDFYQIHYDKDYAMSKGLSGVVVHGALKSAFLGQLVTDWMGEDGQLRRLSCQYRAMDFSGDTLTCKGKVTKKYEKDGLHYVDCEIWIENNKGEKNTLGLATVVLPSRFS